jgi:DNA-binding Lrp family transcriptional regulator
MPRQTLCLVPDAPIASIDPSKFYQTPNHFAMKAIRAKLTGADWCVWSYLQMLDPYGDRMKDLPNPQEIAEAISLSVKQIKRSLVKLEELGFYEIELLQIRGRNLGGATVKESKAKWSTSDKVVLSRQSCPVETKLSNSDKVVSPETTLSKSLPETVTVQAVQISHTSNTYSDLLNTLSEGMRESFEKFCLKKIQECSFKIGSRTAWLNKHGAEYLEEFKETYSYALANPEVTPPKATPFDIPEIPYLKRAYGERWKDVAIHFGLIDPNSPEQEIEEELEPVRFLEETEKLIADSDNPQEPTPPSPAISPKHRKFAKGNTVVIAEPGNIHKGEKGKVIFTSYGSQEDEYRIALDKESHSVREVTIKVPKPCKFIYLTLFSQLQT